MSLSEQELIEERQIGRIDGWNSAIDFCLNEMKELNVNFGYNIEKFEQTLKEMRGKKWKQK